MTNRTTFLTFAGVTAMLMSCQPPGGTPPQGSQPAAKPATAAAPAKAAPAAKAAAEPAKPAGGLKIAGDIAERLERQVPVTIDFDEKLVPEADREVIKKLAEAAMIMHGLFLRQVDEGNPALRAKLAADPSKADALKLFDLMAGPWDRLKEDEPFVGTRAKPKGVSFYPADMTKEEFQAHLKAHPEDKKAFESYFTVIRRKPDRSLYAIPYSKYFSKELTEAAKLLNEAAALTEDTRLRNYLVTRAKAFLSDDYFESDMAWMDLGDGLIEVVIGPYEVYEDGIFGYKAAFEAFLCLRDPEDSKRLETIMEAVPELEKRLPLPKKYTVAPRGTDSPLSVVVEVLSAGDTRAGIQTLAFNLPNDERVRQAKGSKKVMLRNVAHAKFDKILMPIARQLMVPEQLGDVTFAAFFNHTLVHETAHGMGPGVLTLADGTKSDVNRELKDQYSIIEEAKADVLGMWASSQLIEMGKLPKEMEKQVFASALAGFFRSVRFGAHEAHGKANLIQFNYLLKHGAIAVTPEGKFRVDYDKIPKVVEDLGRELLVIEAEGSYEMAQKMSAEYGQMPEVLSTALAGLKGIPIDIAPSFAILEKMKSW